MWYKVIVMMGENGKPGTSHAFMRVDDEPADDVIIMLQKLKSLSKCEWYVNSEGFLECHIPLANEKSVS
jgi:hypothetical protein